MNVTFPPIALHFVAEGSLADRTLFLAAAGAGIPARVDVRNERCFLGFGFGF